MPNGKHTSPQSPDSLSAKLAKARLVAVDLCADRVPRMVEILAELAEHSDREQVRLQAATTIIKVATAREFEEPVDSAAEGTQQPTKVIVLEKQGSTYVPASDAALQPLSDELERRRARARFGAS